MAISWVPKAPQEIDTRRHEFAALLDAGETATAYDATVAIGTVVINQSTFPATATSGYVDYLLAGGEGGETNLINVKIQTSAGRKLEESILLGIRPADTFGSAASPDLFPGYGDDISFGLWLASMGYTLPSDSPGPAVLRARGSAYLDSLYEEMWSGQRTDGVNQANGWPRTGASLNCTIAIADDVIPLAVVNASYRAAWLEASSPGILFGSAVTPGERVRREKVDGAVEVEYFDDGKSATGAAVSFVDPAIDGALRQFICDQSGGAFMWSLGS